MSDVNIHEAKSTLSRLVAAAEDSGTETTLCRAGKPVAKIVPIAKTTGIQARKPGVLKGEIWISDDFEAFLPHESAIFGVRGGQ